LKRLRKVPLSNIPQPLTRKERVLNQAVFSMKEAAQNLQKNLQKLIPLLVETLLKTKACLHLLTPTKALASLKRFFQSIVNPKVMIQRIPSAKVSSNYLFSSVGKRKAA
jgi:hypothetical protein